MKVVNINIKKLVPEAVIPKYAKSGDAGLDLTAVSVNETEMYIEYGTGLAIELPPGYYAAIVPRSSISNYDLVLANTPGTVDQGYRGEIKLRFKKTYVKVLKGVRDAKYYQVGDRIGQMIIQEYPLVLINEVDELEDSSRGSGGFGSSGN